ncbi:MAG: carbon monoxide dehydrogenase [Streptosporangiales bacterium]|nr:carbon monoxide dehydrogenase [Streptosporangiales bacterium]
MKMTGSASLRAEPARVFAALQDPEVLAEAVPGCEQLEPTGDGRYRLAVTGTLASVTGTYDGEVRLDVQPPELLSVQGRLSGAPGAVDGTVLMVLAAAEDGGTELSYDVDVTVAGMLAGVGQRLLLSAVRRVLAEFYAGIDQAVSGAAERTSAAAVTPQASGTVYPTAARERGRPDAGALLLAAAAGAVIALVGVGIGRRLRRLAAR